MNELTFSDYTAEMMRLYERQAYAEAYTWVMEHAHLFPAYVARIYFWRTCLAARQHDTPLALRDMEEGLAAGHWYDGAQLRADSDLAPLQGLPEFERMAALSQQRQADAQTLIKPTLSTLAPDETRSTYPVLLVLHGGGMEEETFYQSFFNYWRPVLAAGWLLAAPHSSQLSAPGQRGWSDNDKSVSEITQHLANLRVQYSLDQMRILVGGFSRGAELAAYLTLSGAIDVRGFIAVAPGGPFTAAPQLWRATITDLGRRKHGYLIAGHQDEMSLRGARELKEILDSNQIACEIETHPNLKHEFPPTFEQSLAKALNFILQN